VDLTNLPRTNAVALSTSSCLADPAWTDPWRADRRAEAPASPPCSIRALRSAGAGTTIDHGAGLVLDGIEAVPAARRAQVAALAWLDPGSSGAPTQRLLPTDVFALVASFGADGSRGDRTGRPDLSVLPLRGRPSLWQPQGRVSLAVALLTPLGLVSALGTPPAWTADAPAPLSDFCGALEQRRLSMALQASATPEERLAALARWLEDRIRRRPRPTKPESRVIGCVATMQAALRGEGHVDELASRQAVTRRQIERDFRHCLGVAPAEYARLLRFQHAAAALAGGSSIVDAALDFGFADQAHLSRQCRAMTGLTPTELANDARRTDRRRLQAALAGRVMLVDPVPGGRLSAAPPSLWARAAVDLHSAPA